MQGSSPAITLLSVRYGSSALLELNRDLTARLNRGVNYEWIAVDNGPEGLEFQEQQGPTPSEFRWIAGVPPLSAEDRATKDRGSQHHAAGLTLGLGAVRTRYLGLMDHDFFVVRPDWIARTLEHLNRRSLGFFGAVWHPRWSYQYRGFPSVHFLIVDLERVPLESLDLRPDIGGDPWDRLVSDPRVPLPDSLRRLLQVGRFRDTGFRLHRRYHRQRALFECLVPHFDFPAAWRAVPPLHRLAHRWLPDTLSPLPQRRQSFTAESFLKTWSPLGYALGWEEFFWQNEAFGFHLRGVGRRPEPARDLEEALRLVTVFSQSPLTDPRQSSRKPGA